MRKHNIERETEMEREGKRVYVQRNDIFKGYEIYKSKKKIYCVTIGM